MFPHRPIRVVDSAVSRPPVCVGQPTQRVAADRRTADRSARASIHFAAFRLHCAAVYALLNDFGLAPLIQPAKAPERHGKVTYEGGDGEGSGERRRGGRGWRAGRGDRLAATRRALWVESSSPKVYARLQKLFQSEQFSQLKESDLQIELDVPTSAPFSTTQTLSSLSAAFASCLSLTSQGGLAGCFQKCA